MWMWRALTCSLLVVGIPLILTGIIALGLIGQERDPIDVLTYVATIPTYIIARLFLIVLPFTTLRSLPPGALTDVDWTVYIPYI
ncbi:hypothetical protein DFH09DRAFT_1157506 [Mycena vulgaris]|nr:hypothetical protein DFH09DRAFT_1157506 [Mycena vulgaris]